MYFLTQGASEYGAAPDSHSSSNFCSVKSCRCQSAQVGEQRAVVGAGLIREQVASKWNKRAICRGHYSCYTVLLLFCSLIHHKYIMSWFLSTWVGLLSNMVAYFKWGGPIFKRKGSWKYARLTLWAATCMSSSPMGIFLRDYGTFFLPRLSSHVYKVKMVACLLLT